MTDDMHADTTLMCMMSIVLDTASLGRHTYTGIAQAGGSATQRRIFVDPSSPAGGPKKRTARSSGTTHPTLAR